MSEFGKKLAMFGIVGTLLFVVGAVITWFKVNQYDEGEFVMNSAQAVLSAVMVVFLSQLKSIFGAIVVAACVLSGSVAEASTFWRCECGYSTRDEGPMNNRDTFEALVDATRSAAHAYDCEIARAENLRRELGDVLVRSRSRSRTVEVAGLFGRLILRAPSSSCPGGRCGVPSAVKPQPLPNDAKASGAVEPTNEQKREAFYKAVREGRIEDALGMSNDWGTGGEKFDGPIKYAIPPSAIDNKPAPSAVDHARRKTVERVKVK